MIFNKKNNLIYILNGKKNREFYNDIIIYDTIKNEFIEFAKNKSISQLQSQITTFDNNTSEFFILNSIINEDNFNDLTNG
jgi:hypothetical protein